jgi:hypothetical protein
MRYVSRSVGTSAARPTSASSRRRCRGSRQDSRLALACTATLVGGAAVQWATPHAEAATTYTAVASGSATAPATYNTTNGATLYPVDGDSIADANSFIVNYGAAEYANGAGLTSLANLSLDANSGLSNVTAIFNQSGGTLSIGTLTLGTLDAAGSRAPDYNISGGTVNVGAISIGGGRDDLDQRDQRRRRFQLLR